MNSSTIIVLVILVILMIPAIRSTITHMKGEGSCCGGPKEKVPKKKMKGKKLYDVAIYIEGMHCDHCKNRVIKKLNELDGVSASVSLAKKRAVASIYKETEFSVLKSSIEKLGYSVVAMEKM